MLYEVTRKEHLSATTYSNQIPRMKETEDNRGELVKLIKKCCLETSTDRPDFNEVVNTLEGIRIKLGLSDPFPKPTIKPLEIQPEEPELPTPKFPVSTSVTTPVPTPANPASLNLPTPSFDPYVLTQGSESSFSQYLKNEEMEEPPPQASLTDYESLFKPNITKLVVGMKLEARDLKNPTMLCVASITAIDNLEPGDPKVLIVSLFLFQISKVLIFISIFF